MSARMRSRVLALACSLASLWTPSLRANPVLYSTSGTVNIANEPDSQIVGVSGLGAVADASGQLRLGSVRITPTDGFSGVAPPNVSNSPFDLRLDFNSSNLPSLELKGVFNPSWGSTMFLDRDWAYLGTVTSIVSSNPSLDANLPAPFADAISSPEVLQLHIGMWDWGIRELPLTLSSDEFKTVPEPSTVALFGLIAALGVRHACANRRRG